MQPTDEQFHILDLVSRTDDNLMIDALAGCGKSSTLELMDWTTKIQPILYLVFAKKNKEEALEKQKGDKPIIPTTTTIQNFNGLGHGIWNRATGGKVTLNKTKSQDLFKQLIDESPKNLRSELWECYWEVIHGVAMAKAVGYIPEGKFPNARRLIDRDGFTACLEETPDELTLDLIDAILTSSIKAAYAGSIDFNDQIYMPALFGGTFPRFPLVKVDEYQDLNPVNHAMLDKLVHGRIVGVGDPWQNIYAFRGAKPGGMDEARSKFRMTSCDLSISFRCPEKVVENARWRVPKFKWLKPGGHVSHLDRLLGKDIADNAAIICRNNAPLFRLAFDLLSNGRSVTVAGSDIGPKLVGLLRRLGDEEIPRSAVLSAIDDWEAEKLSKDSTTAADMAACMRVFANAGKTLGQAITYAEHVLAQKGSIRLLTGHKSKGLEFDTVYLLDTFLLKEDEQDLNLSYVMATRSANELYYINSCDIRW